MAVDLENLIDIDRLAYFKGLQDVEINSALVSKIDLPASASDGNVLTYASGAWKASSLPSAPVTSVNSKNGDVVLSASDVGALPSDTTYVSSINGSSGEVSLTIPSSYEDLSALPSINGVTLTGNKSASNLKLAPEAVVLNITETNGTYTADMSFLIFLIQGSAQSRRAVAKVRRYDEEDEGYVQDPTVYFYVGLIHRTIYFVSPQADCMKVITYSDENVITEYTTTFLPAPASASEGDVLAYASGAWEAATLSIPSSYEDLTALPSINGVGLSGNKTGKTLKLEDEHITVTITEDSGVYSADPLELSLTIAAARGYPQIIVKYDNTNYYYWGMSTSAELIFVANKGTFSDAFILSVKNNTVTRVTIPLIQAPSSASEGDVLAYASNEWVATALSIPSNAADVGALPTSTIYVSSINSQSGAVTLSIPSTAADVGAIANPSEGTTGQVLKKTADGTEWADESGKATVIFTFTESDGVISCDKGRSQALIAIMRMRAYGEEVLALFDNVFYIPASGATTIAEDLVFASVDGNVVKIIRWPKDDPISVTSYIIPSASSTTPQALGTAAAGSSMDFARADHVHSMPSASDVGAIAAPTLPSSGDVLTYTNGVWSAVAPIAEIVWVTYGTSTNAEIEAAYQAGKVVMCVYDNRTYMLTNRGSATSHIFTSAYITAIYRLVCSNNSWANGSRDIIALKASGTPEDLGVPALGTAATAAHADHVHKMPSASDVGAVSNSQGIENAGKFLVVGSDGNVIAVAMSSWQGGNY